MIGELKNLTLLDLNLDLNLKYFFFIKLTKINTLLNFIFINLILFYIKETVN
jgi:hypothetical protein